MKKWTTSGVMNFSGTLICFIKDEDKGIIAQTRGHKTGEEDKCLSNAKLIAAAPELLNAIKKAVSISDLWIVNDENIAEEYQEEFIALNSMYTEFERVINLAIK